MTQTEYLIDTLQTEITTLIKQAPLQQCEIAEHSYRMRVTLVVCTAHILSALQDLKPRQLQGPG